MQNTQLIEKLLKSNLSNYRNLENLWQMARIEDSLPLNDKVKAISAKLASEGNIEFYDLYRKTLLFAAPERLDDYLLYTEIDRQPKDRFYMPRRKVLKGIVDSLQMLMDGSLDELFLSMPPRTGKSTLLTFFCTWLIGRDSECSNLYSAYSDTITTAFYNGVLEIINDKHTYNWQQVFPQAHVVSTDAKKETINIDRRKKYASLTCRSLYGTLNGACDCNGILMSDDLIGGIEEALNKDRLIAAWSKVDNNLIPRAKQSAKLLWCGTRWSMLDPIGIRKDLLENDSAFADTEYRDITIPALDPITEESNFGYAYGVGFSTDFYVQRRASYERNNDMASWIAQYMGEPIEREGALFEPQEMRFYNGILPEGEPDRKFMAVDPAFGGGDFVSAPIAYQYGEAIYLPDVVYDNRDKTYTRPLIIEAIKKHSLSAAQFETTKSTEDYKEYIENGLKEDGYRLNITSKAAPTNKSKKERIFDKAPEIREFYFLESGKRDKTYSMFMNNVFSYKMFGKNKNDDSVDSLAMLAGMINKSDRRVKFLERPF